MQAIGALAEKFAEEKSLKGPNGEEFLVALSEPGPYGGILLASLRGWVLQVTLMHEVHIPS